MTPARTLALALALSALSGCDLGPCEGELLAAGLCEPDPPVEGGTGWCTRDVQDACDVTDVGCREGIYQAVLCFRGGPDGPAPDARVTVAPLPSESDGEPAADDSDDPDPTALHWGRTLQMLGLRATPEAETEADAEEEPDAAAEDEPAEGEPASDDPPSTPTRIYYDEEASEIVIELGTFRHDPGTERWLLAHAMTHALQDREWDLDVYLESLGNSTDAWLGVQSLVRGEAMLWSNAIDLDLLRLDAATHEGFVAFFDDYTSELVATASGSASPYDDTTGTFPYAFGGDFVLRTYRDGGAAAVTEMFAEPPRSAAPPMARGTVESPPWQSATMANQPLHDPPGVWSYLGRDVLGPWCLFLFLLQAGGDVSEAFAAAVEAWRGDRLWIYTRSEPLETILMWQIRWADDASAAAFAADHDGGLGGLDVTWQVVAVGADTFLATSGDVAATGDWLEIMTPFASPPEAD